MRKLFSFLFIFVIIHFLLAPSSYAIVPPKGYVSDCLVANTKGQDGHSAILTIDNNREVKAASGKKTWIFVCITTKDDSNAICSTAGDGVWDKTIFPQELENASYKKLQGLTGKNGNVNGYVGGVKDGNGGFSAQDSPKTLMTVGSVGAVQFNKEIAWGDAYYYKNTTESVTHQWLWTQEAPPVVGAGTAAGTAGAQQQGTFDMGALSKLAKACIPIAWDPKGVVFDVNTFLPVKGMQVQLLKSTNSTAAGPPAGPPAGPFEVVFGRLGVINPNTTYTVNGQYNFFVDEGWYKLKLLGPIAKISSMTPSQAVIADKLGIGDIYEENKPIFEKAGTEKVANIPVDVTDDTLLVKEFTKIEEALPIEENGVIRIFGRVSHPKSKMIFTQLMMNAEGVVKQFVKIDYTDGLGDYNKNISQTVESTEPLVFMGGRVDFELNSFYTTGVFSQKENESSLSSLINTVWQMFSKNFEVNAVVAPANSITIKPIPTYLEGIAYDAQGVAIPMAVVGIYPFFSGNPAYITVADESGRYKIGSQHIPRFEYEIRYKKPTGEVIVIDTSTYVKQNAKLILTEKIQPFAKKETTLTEDQRVQKYFASIDAPVEIKKPTEGRSKNSPSNSTTLGGLGNSRNQTVAQAQPQTTGGIGMLGAGMQGVIMIVVVIMMLIMIGVGAFIMMKSKRQTPQY